MPRSLTSSLTKHAHMFTILILQNGKHGFVSFHWGNLQHSDKVWSLSHFLWRSIDWSNTTEWDPLIFLELLSGSQGNPELRECISEFDPLADCCSAEFRSEYIQVLKDMVSASWFGFHPPDAVCKIQDLSDEGQIFRSHRDLITQRPFWGQFVGGFDPRNLRRVGAV